MRYDDGLVYQDYKDGVITGMNHMIYSGWTVNEVTDWMTDEDNDMLLGTSLALWIISIGEYEVRHNILEERVHDQLCYHIPQFHLGAYTDDLSPEEYEQVKADVEYIESKIEMYPVVKIGDEE